jgi:hypothetical protein
VNDGSRGPHLLPRRVFRDGPAGRRAALASGPDVWEVIAATRTSGLTGEEAIEAAAESGNLAPAQVRVAVRYYSEYRAEIDELVRRNLEEADAAEERWRREQNAREAAARTRCSPPRSPNSSVTAATTSWP